MGKETVHTSPNGGVDVGALQREIITLSRQVKRLVKAESMLYQYQEELDSQLKEYKDLYELNRKLNETFHVEKIFQLTVNYLTQNLDYERAIVLRRSAGSGDYHVSALDGYYDQGEKSCVSALIIPHGAPLLSMFRKGREYLVCTADSVEMDLAEFRTASFLNEFLIFPLGDHSRPDALVAVGNSAGKADFYRRVNDRHGTLVSMGNVIGQVSSSLQKNVLYTALGESEYRLKTVVENLAEGLILIDPDSASLQWNNAALQMYGYSGHGEELASCERVMKLFQLLSLDRKPLSVEQSPVRRVLNGDEFCDYELIVRHKQRDWQRTFGYGGVLIRDGRGNPLVGLLSIRDITYRKQAEEERERLISELQRSNDELQQFAHVSSHDLKEPIRMVTSYAQLLQKRYQGKLDEKGDLYISFIVEAAHRMSSLINDLLDLSRVGRREKPLMSVNIALVVRQALDNMRVTIEENAARITHDLLPTVAGDEIQLLQLFQNLIANAIKYRKPHIAPQIHISAERKENQWLLGVHDNGIGIEPQYHDLIFVIFQRLHHREDYPGTGIGLSICQKIVETHGGRIWVESDPGEGSSFYFTLPAVGQAPGEGAHPTWQTGQRR
jgi:PAS domain S-box-containing protein